MGAVRRVHCRMRGEGDHSRSTFVCMASLVQNRPSTIAPTKANTTYATTMFIRPVKVMARLRFRVLRALVERGATISDWYRQKRQGRCRFPGFRPSLAPAWFAGRQRTALTGP